MVLIFEVSLTAFSLASYQLFMVKKRYNVATKERTAGYLKNFIIGITEFVLKYLRSDRIFYYKNSTSTAEKKEYKINLLTL